MKPLHSRCKQMLIVSMSMLLMFACSVLPVTDGNTAKVAHAAPYTAPELLITEVTPDTMKQDGTTGNPDAFEFIEIYNTTDSILNLKNYRILYESPAVLEWIITEDKFIAPGGTFVIWVTSLTGSTLDDFNRNYGSTLTWDQVFQVTAAGMANASARTLSIASPTNAKFSTASYGPSDVTENAGIQYRYPVDGSTTMYKLSGTGLATPGTVSAGQIPSRALWITEVTPDTKKQDGTSGNPDAFEFIEIYNNTYQTINLKNYRVLYESPAVLTWTIAEDKYVPPGAVFVIWVTSLTGSTLEQFNQNYGTSLTWNQVYKVSADGMANASARAMSIATPDGVSLSRASYSPTDVTENAGIRYAYPTSGTWEMRKLPAAGLATPGAVTQDQIPVDLMITEMTPDTRKQDGTPGNPDAFEFIELFNNSGVTLNLKNYRILYENPSVLEWVITEDKYVAPRSTFVIWVSSLTGSTLAEFNANYGTTLTSSQVFRITADGMANAKPRALSIAAPNNTRLRTAAYYPSDVSENDGIAYLYPLDGNKAMRKWEGGAEPATPGSVFPGQVPAAVPDGSAPAVPAGLTASAGSGQFSLSWLPNGESDLAFYRIYDGGRLVKTVKGEHAQTVLGGLLDEQIGRLQISAVDTSGNESARSPIVTAATWSIPLTQEIIVTTPPTGSFPEYAEWFQAADEVSYIPGMKQGLVPQGMAYLADQDWLIVSNYRQSGKSSMLTVMDAGTGQLVKTLTIYRADGTPYNEHAGGVAISASNVWISSEGNVYRVPLQDVVNGADRTPVYIRDQFATGTRGSFLMYESGKLWVGEYYADGYEVDPAHQMTTRNGTTQYAWMVGYDLDPSTDRLPSGKIVNETTPVIPDYVISLPDKIQGATILSDGRIVLSESYSQKNDAHLYFYENVLAQSPHTYVNVGGSDIPAWYLDGISRQDVLVATPSTEGIVQRGGYLYVMFESAVNYYSGKLKYPTDKIWKVDLSML